MIWKMNSSLVQQIIYPIATLNEQILHFLGKNILTTSVYEADATSVPVYFPGKESWVQITGESGRFYEGGEFAEIPVDINFVSTSVILQIKKHI